MSTRASFRRILVSTIACGAVLAGGQAQALWLSVAKSKEGPYVAYAFNQASRQEADSKAVRSCQARAQAKCDVVFAKAGQGYFAIAASPTHVHVHHAANTKEHATSEAIRRCEVATPRGLHCKLIRADYLKPSKGDATPPAKAARQKVAAKGCNARVRAQQDFEPFPAAPTDARSGC